MFLYTASSPSIYIQVVERAEIKRGRVEMRPSGSVRRRIRREKEYYSSLTSSFLSSSLPCVFLFFCRVYLNILQNQIVLLLKVLGFQILATLYLLDVFTCEIDGSLPGGVGWGGGGVHDRVIILLLSSEILKGFLICGSQTIMILVPVILFNQTQSHCFKCPL